MLYITYARVMIESDLSMDLSNKDKYQIHQLENLVYFPDPLLQLWQIEKMKWNAYCCMTAYRNISEDINGRSLIHAWIEPVLPRLTRSNTWSWISDTHEHVRSIPWNESGIYNTRFARITGISTSTMYFCHCTEYSNRRSKSMPKSYN